MPYTSSGFPPFELMYEKKVSGPIDVLADSCSNLNEENDELIQAYSYAKKLKGKKIQQDSFTSCEDKQSKTKRLC